MQPSLIVTYMEMTTPLIKEKRSAPCKDAAIKNATNISATQYLDLYRQVGTAFRWAERHIVEIESVVQDPEIDVLLLCCDETIAGLCELDRHQFPEIEIKYFGLLPIFIGKGLGSFFLSEVIRTAWSYNPTRLWLHTDEWDHPNAINTYQRNGFHIYKQQAETAHIPIMTSTSTSLQ